MHLIFAITINQKKISNKNVNVYVLFFLLWEKKVSKKITVFQMMSISKIENVNKNIQKKNDSFLNNNYLFIKY